MKVKDIILEAANPAQQAAIAISMKKAGKKPKDDMDEAKQRLDPKCWKGYRKAGTKMKGGTRVNNCVKTEAANPAQQAAMAIAKKKDKGVDENFADGKGPGRPGDSARHGIPKHATKAELEKASHAKGRKGQLARWQINMRNGKNK